jgi:hypothetical protein
MVANGASELFIEVFEHCGGERRMLGLVELPQ